jgi:OOP family OmpA-OmpF porin
MRNTFRKQTGFAAACALALGLLSGGAGAQFRDINGPFYEKVVLDANILFDSNRAALRPAGRDTLDQFVASIHGLDTASIMAIGYADRMGSEGANQILSEERVAAVKAYLVGKGIAAGRVKTSAWGETRPDTVRAQCKDANTAGNVACMQPDRHVFIQVSGNRIAK